MLRVDSRLGKLFFISAVNESMKISYFILFGFFVILILFSITTWINFKQAERVNENNEFYSRSTVTLRNSNRFQRNILNMVSGLRGYLFTGENYFIQAYDSAALENENILKELSVLVPENSVQEKTLKEILTLNSRWINEFGEPLKNAKRLAGSSDSSLVAFNKLYRDKLANSDERNINRALQAKFRDFSNYEYDLRDQRREILTQSVSQTRNISFYLTTLSILIGLAIAFYLAYRISNRIMQMVKMADNIAAGDYESHTVSSGKDELSQLAQALNHMSKVLSENISLLKRKNEELDQFAHIVSHDLKAPLRGIDNVVTWIEEDHDHELSPKVKEYIGLIRGRLTRSENLIQGILSYARVGREQPAKERVDLNQLFIDIQENMPLRPGIKLIVPPKLPVIFTERIPLQQVLSNLVGNALKYHDKNTGQIVVTFFDRKTHYEFEVKDDGPGIAKHYFDKIFVIFQTLQERDTVESTGVGLAIVKKILDDRKQTIQVSSSPGNGASFQFTWPK
jgi:signal transduction histidine kinase